MSDKYSVSVLWSQEDGCYVATVPEIERLSAFGETAAEALAELEIAKELLLEALISKNIPLPEPRLAATFSGQVRLRMPKSLHANLTEEATIEDVSLNTLMVKLLAERIERKKLERVVHNEIVKFAEEKRIEVVIGESTSRSIQIGEYQNNVVEFPQRTSTIDIKRKSL